MATAADQQRVFRIRWIAVITCLAAAAWVGFVVLPTRAPGQEPNAGTTGQSNPAPAAQGSIQSDDDLGQVLANMGYEPQKTKNGAFRLNLKRDPWTFHVDVQLGPSKEFVWLTDYCGEIQDAEKVPASALLKLLVANDKIGPSQFYCDKTMKYLYLTDPIANRGITPALLRKEIDGFCNNISSTADLWDPSKWSAGGGEKQ